MREPDPRHRIYGLVAEFDRPEALLEAARRTREHGFVEFEAYSPFPIEGLSEAVGFHDMRTPLACLAGAVVGAGGGYAMQVYTNLDFPIDIGGRPLLAPPAFTLITFETMVLVAVVGVVLAMLVLNRLPRLHHPLFELPGFRLASSRAFFLVIQSNDPTFDRQKSRAFLEGLGPVRLDEAPFAEQPE
jgi:hypothetical protein